MDTCISLKELYENGYEYLKFGGHIEKTEEGERVYYDLYNIKDELVVCDGERVKVKDKGSNCVVLSALDGDCTIYLSPEEYGIAVFTSEADPMQEAMQHFAAGKTPVTEAGRVPAGWQEHIVCEPMDAEWKQSLKSKRWSRAYDGPDPLDQGMLMLRDRLLSFGGEEVCMAFEEPDLEDILRYGQLWNGWSNVRVKKGWDVAPAQLVCGRQPERDADR